MNWKCDVVMDLASLYHDGVASEGSRRLHFYFSLLMQRMQHKKTERRADIGKHARKRQCTAHTHPFRKPDVEFPAPQR